MKIPLNISIVLICACLFCSCASSGPTYQSVKSSLKPQAGKGLALIYYDAGIYGAAAKWHIYANDQLLTDRFSRGSFYSFQANPGDLRLSTTHNMTWVPVGVVDQALGTIRKDQPTLRILPNQTYYITMGMGMWREKLFEVPKEKGEADIQDCHWINPQ
jgi:hypothetical protein